MVHFSMSCCLIAVIATITHTQSFNTNLLRAVRRTAGRGSVARISSYSHHRLSMSPSIETTSATNVPGNVPNSNLPQVEVYSTLGCKFCKKAKFKLDELGVPYFNVDITEPSVPSDASRVERQSLRVEHARQRTVPQIYIGEELIGGCDNLLEEVGSGMFSERMGRHGVIATPISDTAAAAATSSSTASSSLSPSTEAERLAAIMKDGILNTKNTVNTEIEPQIIDPVALSVSLQKQALLLTDKYSSLDGSRVDYKKMRGSVEFEEYRRLSVLLQDCSVQGLAGLSVQMRTSFFVNLYNAMIIHANCVLGPPTTPEGRSALYSGRSGARYKIGSCTFSPDDIEHGVLRGNNPHPSQVGEGSYMKVWDERAVLALPYLDPRMHFVLNCGAVSCPPIRVLGADPELALSTSAAAYLEGEVDKRVEEESGLEKVFLSKLTLWYTADFGRDTKTKVAKLFLISRAGGKSRRVLGDLLQLYRDNEEAARVREGLTDEERIELIAQGEREIDGMVRYNPYNWTNNDTDQ